MEYQHYQDSGGREKNTGPTWVDAYLLNVYQSQPSSVDRKRFTNDSKE